MSRITKFEMKPLFRSALKTSFLAWMWIALALLHMGLSVYEFKSALWTIFENMVFASSFLVFSMAGLLRVTDADYSLDQSPLIPFASQFIFWWGIGYLIVKAYEFWAFQRNSAQDKLEV